MTLLWFACEQPERPTDALVRWHEGQCKGCSLKAQATIHQHAAQLSPVELRILNRLAGV